MDHRFFEQDAQSQQRRLIHCPGAPSPLVMRSSAVVVRCELMYGLQKVRIREHRSGAEVSVCPVEVILGVARRCVLPSKEHLFGRHGDAVWFSVAIIGFRRGQRSLQKPLVGNPPCRSSLALTMVPGTSRTCHCIVQISLPPSLSFALVVRHPLLFDVLTVLRMEEPALPESNGCH